MADIDLIEREAQERDTDGATVTDAVQVRPSVDTDDADRWARRPDGSIWVDKGGHRVSKRRLEAIAGHKWQPGQCPNPGGKPKTPEEVKQRLKEVLPEALETAIAVMRSSKSKPSTRLLAAQDVLDRVLGKASQPIDADVTAEVVVRIADDLKDGGKG